MRKGIWVTTWVTKHIGSLQASFLCGFARTGQCSNPSFSVKKEGRKTFFFYGEKRISRAPRTARAKAPKRRQWRMKRGAFVTVSEETDRKGGRFDDTGWACSNPEGFCVSVYSREVQILVRWRTIRYNRRFSRWEKIWEFLMPFPQFGINCYAKYPTAGLVLEK